PGAFYRGSDISLGGGRTRSAQILIDGVTSSRGGVAAQQVDLTPPVDSMQEFKVEVNAMGAENGRASAGAVNGLTRSRANKFNGSFYEFLRNDELDAAGWNNDTKPPLRLSPATSGCRNGAPGTSPPPRAMPAAVPCRFLFTIPIPARARSAVRAATHPSRA